MMRDTVLNDLRLASAPSQSRRTALPESIPGGAFNFQGMR